MYCKQLFNHAVKLDLIGSNPASAFAVDDAGGIEKSRDRALSIDELAFAFKKFREESDSFTRENDLACALLVLLGVRKTELTEALWSEFDLERQIWQLPQARSKSGVAIDIPLPDLAVSWLNELRVRAFDSPYVFPNRRCSKMPHMGRDTLNRAISKLFGKEPGKAGGFKKIGRSDQRDSLSLTHKAKDKRTHNPLVHGSSPCGPTTFKTSHCAAFSCQLEKHS